MITAKQNIVDSVNASVRHIKGRVELYKGSTLVQIFSASDHLKSFKVEKIGEEGKFFGFGVTQKLTVSLIDKDRALNITQDHSLEVAFGADSDYVYSTPIFMVETVERDENTNELTITAYDGLYKMPKHTVSELQIRAPYSIKEFAIACATLIGYALILPEDETMFNTVYEEGGNFEGTETIREVLNDIAEVTQTVFYIDRDWNVIFRELDRNGQADLTIPKDKYFTLKADAPTTIAGIAHVTELGDNVEAVVLEEDAGRTVVQYVRENPFWEMHEDLGPLLQWIADRISGFTMNGFELSWRGNYLVEIGDKIDIECKDGSYLTTYVLNDAIHFDGGMKQSHHWHYESREMETENNPANLGEALNKTFAKVDKANKRIEMVASETTANSEAISAIQINTDNINASVKQLEEVTTNAFDGINEELATLTNKVEATMTAEDVRIEISSVLENGVNKVETTTGFTFNEEGLTVSKSGSDITTTITEDGMTVYREDEAVLVADNEGVKAEDLHATTYLIIGTHSRFEDYGDDRTGCFWLG